MWLNDTAPSQLSVQAQLSQFALSLSVLVRLPTLTPGPLQIASHPSLHASGCTRSEQKVARATVRLAC